MGLRDCHHEPLQEEALSMLLYLRLYKGQCCVMTRQGLLSTALKTKDDDKWRLLDSLSYLKIKSAGEIILG